MGYWVDGVSPDAGLLSITPTDALIILNVVRLNSIFVNISTIGLNILLG